MKWETDINNSPKLQLYTTSTRDGEHKVVQVGQGMTQIDGSEISFAHQLS